MDSLLPVTVGALYSMALGVLPLHNWVWSVAGSLGDLCLGPEIQSSLTAEVGCYRGFNAHTENHRDILSVSCECMCGMCSHCGLALGIDHLSKEEVRQ